MHVLRRTSARGRPASSIALAIVSAIALAGCSDPEPVEEVRVGASTPGAAATTAVTSEPGQTEPSPPVTGGTVPPGDTFPAVTTIPAGTTIPGDRRHPHRWDGYTAGADGRTLTFSYYAGVEPCSAFDSIVADEAADSVRVTIYEHSGPEGVACIMLAQQKFATVTLDAPLGTRSVVDGA